MHDLHRAESSSSSQWVGTVSLWNLLTRARSLRLTLAVGMAISFSDSTSFAQPGLNRPAAPKKKADSKQTKKSTPEKSTFEQPDPDWLPPSFQPLPEPPAIMELEQPIATADEVAKLKKDFSGKFAKVLRDCDLSTNGKQVIAGGLRFKLAEMTQGEKRKLLPDLHKTLMREITTGIGSPGSKPADVASTTQFVNQELLRQIPELLVNNFYVRLHAVLILSELDYAPAHTLLVQMISAKNIEEDPVNGQPQAVKIAAMQGLIRILKFAQPQATVKERGTIAVAIVAELAKPENHWWYQLRLIEGLRNMTVALDTANNTPFVIQSLLSVVKDPNRVWTVRAKACYALGRVPVPPVVKVDDLVTAISECALQMANDAQAKPNNPIWKGCFWDLYLAFKPDGSKDKDGKDKDLDAEGKALGGLLARFRPVAQPAYDVIVPICSGVIQGKAPDPGDVQKLGGFVRGRLAMHGGARDVIPVNNQVPDKPAELPDSDRPTNNNAGVVPAVLPNNSSVPAGIKP